MGFDLVCPGLYNQKKPYNFLQSLNHLLFLWVILFHVTRVKPLLSYTYPFK